MPLLTWAPAQDTRQPGILEDVVNACPTDRGYASAGQVEPDTGVYGSTPQRLTSGISAIAPDGLYHGFVGASGIPSRILFYRNGFDAGRPANYSNSVSFCFAATANFVYAANGADPLQRYSLVTLGNFADVANCPIFQNIIIAGGRLWGFGTTVPITYGAFTYSASPSRWWVSAVGVNEDFAPSIATGASTDLLDDQDGGITAAIEFNGFPLVFKRSAIYVLEDDGAFVVERKIHNEFGCIGPYALTKCDNRVYFWSPSNGGELCMFDGNTVVSLSRNILKKERYVGLTNVTTNASGGNESFNSSQFRETNLSAQGRYVFVHQYSFLPGFGDTSNALIFDSVTGRFGRVFHQGLATEKPIPFFCWTSADNNKIIAIAVTAAGAVGGAVSFEKSVALQGSSYKIYREQRGGDKATINSGKAYFAGVVPAGTAQVVGEFPTLSSLLVNTQSDGRWSGANVTAQRHTTTLSYNASHELTDIEIDVAAGGRDQTKPRGKQ